MLLNDVVFSVNAVLSQGTLIFQCFILKVYIFNLSQAAHGRVFPDNLQTSTCMVELKVQFNLTSTCMGSGGSYCCNTET